MTDLLAVSSKRKSRPVLRWQQLAQLADEIRTPRNLTGAAIVLIGGWLAQAKALIPVNRWEPWLHFEVGWSEQTAERFLRAYQGVMSGELRLENMDVRIRGTGLSIRGRSAHLQRLQIASIKKVEGQ